LDDSRWSGHNPTSKEAFWITESEMNEIGDLSPYFGDLRADESYATPDSRFMTMCWNEYSSTAVSFTYAMSLQSMTSSSFRKKRHDRYSFHYQYLISSFVSLLHQQDDRYLDNPTDWKSLSDDDIVTNYAMYGGHVRYTNGKYGYWFPCIVVGEDKRRANDNYKEIESSYIVRIFDAKVNRRLPAHLRERPRIYRQFPRSSIRFFTRPFMSDQHFPDTFRHHIGIPDEIFPEQWKNRVQ
jgi:hypothetical protein